MDLGRVIAEGTFDEVMADPEVRHAYLGADRMTSRRAARAPVRSTRSPGPATAPAGPRGGPRERRLRPLPGPVRRELHGPRRGGGGLLGSNGAGKSTVARVVTGLCPATSGTVRVDGQDVTGLAAYKIARAGMAHVPEGRGIFANLTVEENLVLAFRQRGGRQCVPESLARAYEAFPCWASAASSAAGRCRAASSGCLSLAKVLVCPAQAAGGRRALARARPGGRRRRLRRAAPRSTGPARRCWWSNSRSTGPSTWPRGRRARARLASPSAARPTGPWPRSKRCWPPGATGPCWRPQSRRDRRPARTPR